MRFFLRSKIHNATIVESNINYTGSITIDKKLMKLVGLLKGEKVLISDSTNGARLETYVIPGRANSGIICINGAAAHLMHKNDKIIIMGFELSKKKVKTKKILVNDKNKFVRYL